MKKILVLLALACCFGVTASANSLLDSLEYDMRLGYCIGGTAPVNMPATIRSLNDYSFQRNFSLGVDARKQLSRRWGVMAGLRIENKGMHIDADVKNYHMAIVRGGERLEGYFTGCNNTKVEEWMLTVPVMATFHTGRWLIKCGPYMSYVATRSFKGHVYDGYLRTGNPTGDKVDMGPEDEDSPTYDFSEDMRKFHVGIAIGADYRIGKRLGVYADLTWGLNDAFKSSFKTIEQTLYPIYGTIGLTYKLK